MCSTNESQPWAQLTGPAATITTTLASGSGTPPNPVATFNPAGQAPGTYAIAVSATTAAGSAATAVVDVIVPAVGGGGRRRNAGPGATVNHRFRPGRRCHPDATNADQRDHHPGRRADRRLLVGRLSPGVIAVHDPPGIGDRRAARHPSGHTLAETFGLEESQAERDAALLAREKAAIDEVQRGQDSKEFVGEIVRNVKAVEKPLSDIEILIARYGTG